MWWLVPLTLPIIYYAGKQIFSEDENNVINKYSIIKNLAINDLTDHVNHLRLYESIELRWRTEIINH